MAASSHAAAVRRKKPAGGAMPEGKTGAGSQSSRGYAPGQAQGGSLIRLAPQPEAAEREADAVAGAVKSGKAPPPVKTAAPKTGPVFARLQRKDEPDAQPATEPEVEPAPEPAPEQQPAENKPQPAAGGSGGGADAGNADGEGGDSADGPSGDTAKPAEKGEAAEPSAAPEAETPEAKTAKPEVGPIAPLPDTSAKPPEPEAAPAAPEQLPEPDPNAPKAGEDPAALVAAVPSREPEAGDTKPPGPDEFPMAPPVKDAEVAAEPSAGGEQAEASSAGGQQAQAPAGAAPEAAAGAGQGGAGVKQPGASGAAAKGADEEAAAAAAAASNEKEEVAERAIQEKGSGQPLDKGIRATLERILGADFKDVRVHDDAPAQKAAKDLEARAFTHANHIWIGEGERASDLELMAHELTHVVQQGAAKIVRPTPENQKLQSGGAPDVQPGVLDRIGSGIGAAWDATGGRVVEAGAEVFWSTLESIAPGFVPFLREVASKGIVGYLSEKLEDAVSSLFRFSGSPSGLKAMFLIFSQMWTTMGEILRGLMAGDCGPLLRAISSLKATLGRLATDAWSGIVNFLTPIGDFFAKLWGRFGAPVWDWLKETGGQVWEFISGLGRKIWDWTEPVRGAIGGIWNWVKGKLGFGGSDDTSNEGGITSWIKGKLGQAWDAIKERMAPVVAPIQAVWTKVKSFLPIEKIVNLRDTIRNWLGSVGAAASALEAEDGVTARQGSLRDTILPALLARIADLRAGIVETGLWLGQQLGGVIESAASFIAGLSQVPILSMASGAWTWLSDALGGMRDWVSETTGRLFTAIGDGLGYLSDFIKPIYDTLVKLVNTVANLMGNLADLVLGATWGMIPCCIRNPIKNFIIQKILKKIPFFGQFVDNPEIWQRMSETAMTVLQQIFVDGDIAKAAWTIFKAFLRIFGVPPQLVTGIIRKAAQFLGDLLMDPLGFMMNLLRAIKQGFVQFFAKIGTYLMRGVSGWLFGELAQAGLQPPEDFSLKSILKFVLQILDITMERVFARLEAKIGREKVQRLRRAVDMLSGAWEWVKVLIQEGPGGLWRFLQDKLSNLWDTVLNSSVDWVSDVIIREASAKLMAFLDVTGIMPIINGLIALYRSIESFMKYLQQMLEIVNKVLDGLGEIVRGAIETAANYVEGALGDAMPVAMGFLANQIGLRDVGKRVKEMVEKVRALVDRAIDWLIDKALAAGRWLLDQLRRGANAVRAGVRRLLYPRKEFNIGAHHHTISVSQNGVPMISSVTQSIEEFLTSYGAGVPAARKPLVKAAKDALTEMKKQITAMNAHPNPDSQVPKVLQAENVLAEKLKSLIPYDSPLDFENKFRLEGLVATYADMPRNKGDKLTPDHQPQNALFEWAAEQPYFKKASGDSPMQVRADNRSARALCINLSSLRHEEGRTYGHKGDDTKKKFISRATTLVAPMKAQDKRNAIVDLIKKDRDDDVQAIKNVLKIPTNWQDIQDQGKAAGKSPADIKKVKDKVEKQILDGEQRILFQNLDTLKNL